MEKENYQEYFITLDKLIELLTKMKIRQNQSHHNLFIKAGFLGGKKPKDYSQEYYTILSGDPDKDPDFDSMKSHLQDLKELLSKHANAGLKPYFLPETVTEEDTDSFSIIPEKMNREEKDDKTHSNHIIDGKSLQSAEEEEDVYSNPFPLTTAKPESAEKSYELPTIPVKDRSGLQLAESVHTDKLPLDIKVYIEKIFNTYDEKIDEKLKDFKKNSDSKLRGYVTKDLLCQEVQLLKQRQEEMQTEMLDKLSALSASSKEENKKRETDHVLSHQEPVSRNGVADLLSKSNIRSSTSSDLAKEGRPAVDNETRRAMRELANEYNSMYKYTEGMHLNLKTEFAKAWASGGKSFQSEEEAKKLPLVEFQGNYTYLAVEAEGDTYYLMPRKGMKLTPGLIQHAAYDQFFAYNLPEGTRELKIHLDEPAIVEKRGDEYYLVRRGSISF